jgi:SAM-dependent methyltransferase
MRGHLDMPTPGLDRSFLLSALSLSAALAGACVHDGSRARDPRGGSRAHWADASFSDPRRESYRSSERIVQLLRLRGDEHVADLGCGSGAVSAPLARALPRGRVYAADVDPAQLGRLNERIAAERLGNVVPVLCVADDARLPAGSVDAILIVDTYHHLQDRVAYLQRLARALRPSGVIVNVDFRDGDLPVGPPRERRVPRERMIAEFRSAGFGIAREENEFPHHHFLVFARENPWRAP